MSWSKKLKEWAFRYGPAEIVGTLCALGGASLGSFLSSNNIVAAFAGTWGENLGYYGTISFRDIRAGKSLLKSKNKSYGIFDLIKNLRNLIFEFGLGEVLDSFVVRPFWLYTMPIVLNNFTLGIIAGKLAADVTFYIPTIVSYELRKRYAGK